VREWIAIVFLCTLEFSKSASLPDPIQEDWIAHHCLHRPQIRS